MYTLADLINTLRDGIAFYSFPGSPMDYEEETANEILRICNFTGRLTDMIQPIVISMLLDRIEKLEDHLNTV